MGFVKMEDSKKSSSEAADSLGSSGRFHKAETSASKTKKIETYASDEPKRYLNCVTIARIYMEETPYGFYIQVYENHSRRPQRIRVPEDHLGEICLDFMITIPVKSFVKVTINNKLEGMIIRIECLALRDKGYDCGNINFCRNSLARRFAHIVFRAREEIVRISIHELSNFTEVFPVCSFSSSSGSVEGRNGDGCSENEFDGTKNDLEYEAIENAARDPEVTHSTASLFANSVNDDIGNLSQPSTERSTPDILDRSSTASSRSSDRKNEPHEADSLAAHFQLGSVNSLADDLAAHSSATTKLTKASGNRCEVPSHNLQSTAETFMLTCMEFGRSDDELVPLLGSTSRDVARRKRVAQMMSKAGGLFNHFIRKSNPTTLRCQK